MDRNLNDLDDLMPEYDDKRESVPEHGKTPQISPGTYRTPFSACPSCSQPLDAATDMDPVKPEMPKPGDVSVCRHCAQMLEFDLNLKLIILSPDTFVTLDKDTQQQLRNMQRLARST